MIPAQEIMTFHPIPPVLQTISPASGTTAGGTPITLTGRGFRYANLIVFGGTNVTSFTIIDDTTITFTSPAHAAGIINATVRNPAGTSAPGGVYTYVTPVVPAVTRYQSPGAQSYVVPVYNTLTIEGWGGGAGGGQAAACTNGNPTTMPVYSLVANGGNKATTNSPNSGTGFGTGGTASGGNNTNATGGNGDPPSPTTSAGGTTGRGGSAPNGGAGGAPVAAAFGVTQHGNPGNAPGGGGSGQAIFQPFGGGTESKYPGGGSSGYFQHVFTAGAPGAPAPGTVLNFNVGAGGVANLAGTIFGGAGANGEMRFTVA